MVDDPGRSVADRVVKIYHSVGNRSGDMMKFTPEAEDVLDEMAAICELGNENGWTDEQIAEATRDYLKARFPDLNPTLH